jgi:hypothetical protein
MIPQQQIERIKETANDDIVAVIEKYVKLKRSGNSYKGLCPFHDENTPSFSVSEQRGIYKCFGCDEGGDAVDFVMKMEGMDFIEAIRHLAGMLGIIITEKEGKKPNNYTPPNKLIPGIKKAKRHIRKEECALLCFNKGDFNQLQKQGKTNAIYLPAYRPAQVEIIAKYTDTVVIYPKGLNRRKFFKALEITHRKSLSILLANNAETKATHWLNFIIQHFPSTTKIRSACIKIIAQIPDAIYRTTETQYLAKHWDKSNAKENT